MKVTAIKQQQRDPGRVSVFIDGRYSFSLTLDQLLQEKLKKDLNIDQPRLEYLQGLSSEGKLKQRAMEWLLLRPHSTKEFHDYLRKKKIPSELVTVWTDEFIAKKYLNDSYFAVWFAGQRAKKNKSAREITAELSAKGVRREAIPAIVAAEADEAEAVRQLVGKLRKRSQYQDDRKLKAYLYRKGFPLDVINVVLKEAQ